MAGHFYRRRWGVFGALFASEQCCVVAPSERAKPSDVGYIVNRHPLLERRMTRADCIAWLRAHELDVPTKSSCVFCPYHDRAAWQDLKRNGDGDWQHAVLIDESIRRARPPFDLFVHPSRRPLREVGKTIDAQPELPEWSSEECSGYCWL